MSPSAAVRSRCEIKLDVGHDAARPLGGTVRALRRVIAGRARGGGGRETYPIAAAVCVPMPSRLAASIPGLCRVAGHPRSWPLDGSGEPPKPTHSSGRPTRDETHACLLRS
jgi:hypothetical protein